MNRLNVIIYGYKRCDGNRPTGGRMTYEAKINGTDVTYKNRTVLEVIRQNIAEDFSVDNYRKIYGKIEQNQAGV